jgi:hypothetical protein
LGRICFSKLFIKKKKSKVKIKSPTPEFFFEECSGFGGQGAEGASHAIPLCGFRLRRKALCLLHFRAKPPPPLPFIKDHPQLPSRPILLAPLRAATSFLWSSFIGVRQFIYSSVRGLPDEANRGRVGCFNYSPSPHIITPFDSAILENRKAAEDTP